jgi:uncharacterized protein
MGAMKTPGVYIVEKNAFPNSVVEVATAVPAFIGYTEKADNKGKSLSNQPWRITSMAEFQNYFGFGPSPQFTLGDAATPTAMSPLSLGGKQYVLSQIQGRYLLYYSMLLFFQNGGGPCFVVSIGNYSDAVDPDKLKGGIDLLVKEQEPTIVVIPDAVLLPQSDCIGVQQHMLDHCGNVMKNRVAILDISDGYRSRQDPAGDPVAMFRNSLGINFLNFGMTYYPWVHTTINQAKDLAYWNLDDAAKTELQALLKVELNIDGQPADKAKQLQDIIDGIAKVDATPQDNAMLNKSLIALSPLYNMLLTEMASTLNLLPPAAAMAGVFTMVDNNRGVWKAPANVSLNSVTAPVVNITHGDQEDLNVSPQGKSVNAIRAFVGEGTLVWGARTLDGNSLDWRYINVRRTMIMLEESVKLATKAYVFEPNVANTWVTIKSMIRNFLTGVWKKGGLAGAVPDDAFGIFCGLGETMTPEDILEGILRVTVLVAISRPAEFIEITFQQQMQKS